MITKTIELPEVFGHISATPELSRIEAEARKIDAVAEAASELHRHLWGYLKAMQTLHDESNNAFAFRYLPAVRERIAEEAGNLEQALNGLQTVQFNFRSK